MLVSVLSVATGAVLAMTPPKPRLRCVVVATIGGVTTNTLGGIIVVWDGVVVRVVVLVAVCRVVIGVGIVGVLVCVTVVVAVRIIGMMGGVPVWVLVVVAVAVSVILTACA